MLLKLKIAWASLQEWLCNSFFLSFDLSIDNAHACDPRIKKFREEEKKRKADEKKAKQEAIKALALEKERVCYL